MAFSATENCKIYGKKSDFLLRAIWRQNYSRVEGLTLLRPQLFIHP
jgi:hypothetical protein